MTFDFSDASAASSTNILGQARREGSAWVVEVERGGDSLQLYGFPSVEHCRRAVLAHSRLGEHLFAVPEVLDSGENWLLVDCRGGVNVRELLLEREMEDLSELGRTGASLASSMGIVLAKLHNVPVAARFGEPETKESGRSWLTFSGYVASRLELYHEDLRKRSFDEPTTQKLAKTIADLRQELASFHPRTPTSWIHGRPGIEHFWVHRETFDIVAFTGFEHSCLLPREADISAFLFLGGLANNDRIVRSFYTGYGAARTMDVQRRERFYRRFLGVGALMGQLGEVNLSRSQTIDLLK